MSKKTTMKPLAAALGTAFALGVAATPAAADTANPFGMTDLSSGYQQVAEGKCGEAKCGAKPTEAKPAEGKCGEKKAEEGKCGGEKATEAKCGEKKPEAKCGGNK
jgi:uncharacterized low-complexity protein